MNLAEWFKAESDALDAIDNLSFRRILESLKPDENGMIDVSFPEPPKWLIDACEDKDSQ